MVVLYYWFAPWHLSLACHSTGGTGAACCAAITGCPRPECRTSAKAKALCRVRGQRRSRCSPCARAVIPALAMDSGFVSYALQFGVLTSGRARRCSRTRSLPKWFLSEAVAKSKGNKRAGLGAGLGPRRSCRSQRATARPCGPCEACRRAHIALAVTVARCTMV